MSTTGHNRIACSMAVLILQVWQKHRFCPSPPAFSSLRMRQADPKTWPPPFSVTAASSGGLPRPSAGRDRRWSRVQSLCLLQAHRLKQRKPKKDCASTGPRMRSTPLTFSCQLVTCGRLRDPGLPTKMTRKDSSKNSQLETV